MVMLTNNYQRNIMGDFTINLFCYIQLRDVKQITNKRGLISPIMVMHEEGRLYLLLEKVNIVKF